MNVAMRRHFHIGGAPFLSGMGRKGSLAGILVSRLTGIILFLILIGVLNVFADVYVGNPVFLRVVAFLNANVGFLILIAVIFLLGDLFCTLVFPLNLPGPIFGALGAVFVVAFIFRVFMLASDMTGIEVFRIFSGTLAHLIYVLVFAAVLIGDYISLFSEPSGRA